MEGENMNELTEIRVSIGQLETSMKQAFHMINEHKEQMKSIYALASNIEKLAFEMSQMRQDQNEIKNKVETIEQKPIKTYDAIKMQIILSVVTAIIGFLIGKII